MDSLLPGGESERSDGDDAPMSLSSVLDIYLEQAEDLTRWGTVNPLMFIYETMIKKNGDAADGPSLEAATKLIEDLPFNSLKKKLILKSLEQQTAANDSEDNFTLQDNNVIKKIVLEENLSHLVINLHQSSEGYSVAIKKSAKSLAGGDGPETSDTAMQTMKLSYEEDDLLNYIDNEELPPFLVDLIESSEDESNHSLFHSGCVIAEVRDYRRNANTSQPNFDSTYVILKPSNQTLINDVNKLTAGFVPGQQRLWTEEERLSLEANLINSTAEPLCLDPSPLVGIVATNLHYEKKWLKSSSKIRKLSRTCSQPYRNRVKRNEALPAPKGLELHDFLSKKKNRPAAKARVNKFINPFTSEQNLLNNAPVPNVIDVAKYAKQLEQPQFKAESSLVKAEDFIMEFMEQERRSTYTCVSIFHRPIDDAYFGQLYVNRNRDDQHPVQGGSSCLFRLGTKASTKKYIDQFTDILTENGKKSVKITHQVPGHAAKVSFTVGATPISVPREIPNRVEELPLASPVVQKIVVPQEAPHHKIPALSFPSAPSIMTSLPMLQTIDGQSVQPLPKVVQTKSETPLAVLLTSHSVANLPSHGVSSALKPCEPVVATTEVITPQPQHIAPNIQPAPQPLPTGVSLSLAPGQNLRLHNLVQLTNVQGVTQSIAVPISLTMMPGSNSGAISTQAIMTSNGPMIMNLDGHKANEGHQQQVVLVDAAGNHIGDASTGATYAGHTVLMQTMQGTPATVSMTGGSAGNVYQLPIGVQNLAAQLMGGTIKPMSNVPQGANISILQMNSPQTSMQPQQHQLQMIRPLPSVSVASQPIVPQLATQDGLQGCVQIQKMPSAPFAAGQQLQYVMQKQQQAPIQIQNINNNQGAKRKPSKGKGKTC